MSGSNPFEDDVKGEKAATPEALLKLTEKANQQIAAEAVVSDLEDQLDKAKKVLAVIADEEVPALMQEIGMSKFTTKNGFNIELKEYTRANIKAENKAAAFAWLQEIGSGGIIKNDIVFSFGIKESENAADLIKFVQGYNQNLTASKKQKVEPATLSKLIRGMQERGEEVDESVTVFHQATAVVKAAN